MKKLGLNPYLPFWETVPDGEPHVFGERLYIYGSHDRRGGHIFCEQDYVCWSAPTDDLTDWRCEGVIYTKEQDPLNGACYAGIPQKSSCILPNAGMHYLYAPDAVQGPDNRYYLYYSLDNTNIISVAVCDTPAGHYQFLNYVTRKDGSIPELGRCFDPAILSEKNGNYLYYGFCPKTSPSSIQNPGAIMVRLADDMYTIIEEPVCIVPGYESAQGTPYANHAFFEAPSIRKINSMYYFVYSSIHGHELCYATSHSPDGPFQFRGIIISNGDIGYNDNTLPVNYTGNNHGGLVTVGEQTYIFYHRQTHGTSFSRQGCAEPVQIMQDGTIPQVELTSCGLNLSPLPSDRTYSAQIACHLTEGDRNKVGQVLFYRPGDEIPSLPEKMPYITEETSPLSEHGLYPFIHNMQEGAIAGFKYFYIKKENQTIRIRLRGHGEMELLTTLNSETVLCTWICSSTEWIDIKQDFLLSPGCYSLYFRTKSGTLDFGEFQFIE